MELSRDHIHFADIRQLNQTGSTLWSLTESSRLRVEFPSIAAGRVCHIMHQLFSPATHVPLDHVRRVSRSFVELNARIARLAMMVDAPLTSEQDIQKIIHRQTGNFQATTDTAVTQSGAGTSGRLAQQWNELRGLLVLRCNLITQMLDDLGLELTEQVVMQGEEHLERVGFKRGADGFHLLPNREV